MWIRSKCSAVHREHSSARTRPSEVLNITTKEPTPAPTGSVSLAYYEGNEFRATGSISGPLTNRVLGRLAVSTGSYDGNMQNLFYGRTVDGDRHESARAKLTIDWSDTLTLRIAADYTRSSDDMPPGAFTSSSQIPYCPRYPVNPPLPNACQPGVSQPNPTFDALLRAQDIHPSLDNTQVSQNGSNSGSERLGGASVRADQELDGGHLLTLITAWRSWQEYSHDYDFDQVSIHSAVVPQISDHGSVSLQQVSQELRVTSSKRGPVDFVAGLYFMHIAANEIYGRDVIRYDVANNAARFDYGHNRFGSANDNFAVFGEANVHFTGRFRGLLGYRGIWDRVSFYTDRVSTSTAANPVPGVSPSYVSSSERTIGKWSGRVGLEYDLAPKTLAYIAASRGYKGPAYNVFFNMSAGNTAPIDPETSNSYEAGIKSIAWGGRAQLEAAAFFTEINDYQGNAYQLINGAFVTNFGNVGTVVTRGAELSLDVRPLERSVWHFSSLYNDAFTRTFRCGPAAYVCDFNGNRLPYAPKWRVQATQEYRHTISPAMDLNLYVDYRWQSSMTFQYSDTSDLSQSSYGIWDAAIGLSNAGEKWTAWLTVKNVLDQNYSSYAQPGNLAGVTRWVPRDASRYVGVQLQKDFF